MTKGCAARSPIFVAADAEAHKMEKSKPVPNDKILFPTSKVIT